MYYATRRYIDVLVAGLSASTGVTVIPGKEWKASPATKTLVYNEDSLRTMPFDAIRGVLLHEIGHLEFTSSSFEPNPKYLKKYGIGKLQIVYNLFEDFRIEKMLRQRYGYYADNALNAVNAWGLQETVVDPSYIKDFPLLIQFLLMTQISGAMRAIHRSNHHGEYQHISRLADAGIDHGTRYFINNYRLPIDEKAYNRFMDDDVLADIKEIVYKTVDGVNYTSTQQLVDAVDSLVIPHIEDFLEEMPDQQEDQQGQSAGQSASGDEDDGGNGEEDSEGNQEGKGGYSVSPTDRAKEQGENPASQKGKGSDMNKAEDFKPIMRMSEDEARAALSPYITTLANRMRNILKENAQTRWRGAHKQGKLLNKNAYKVLVPQEERMFSKKTTPDMPKYGIYLALDYSGSMEGEKALYAFMAGVMLKHTALNLRFDCQVYKWGSDAERISDLEKYAATSGGTYDTSVLRLIAKDVDYDKENLIFIITDGQTEYPQGSERLSLLKKLERSNNQVYGVGVGQSISESQLRQSYDHPVYVQNVEELPDKLISIVHQFVHR